MTRCACTPAVLGFRRAIIQAEQAQQAADTDSDTSEVGQQSRSGREDATKVP
jgi:hypothetical protein